MSIIIKKAIPLIMIALAITLVFIKYAHPEGEDVAQINGSISIDSEVENVDNIADGRDSITELNIHSVIMGPYGGQIGGDITISGKAGTISCLGKGLGSAVKVNIGSVVIGIGTE